MPSLPQLKAVVSSKFLVAGLGIGGVVLGLAWPRPASAQFRGRRGGFAVRDVADENTDENSSGIYVRDLPPDAYNDALRKQAEKEWPKAAEFFQQIFDNDKYRDRLISVPPSEEEKKEDKGRYRYKSLALDVQQRLAHWPAEGLNVYRGRYEPDAAALLERAGRDDVDTLNRVFFRYFVTDSAKAAGIRLMDLYLETGEFTAAGSIGDRLLDLPHPNLILERPQVLFRTALAYHLAGDDQAAQPRFQELKNNYGQEVATVHGQNVRLAEELEKDLKLPTPVAMPGVTGDSWPTFGGNSRVPAVAGRPGARLCSIDLVRSKVNPRSPYAAALRQQEESIGRSGMSLGIMPVTDRGELYFQDGSRVYAASLESGLPLPGWARQYPGELRGTYTSKLPNTSRTGQYTLTLTDDAVLGVLGQSDRQALLSGEIAPGQRETRLVCLERADGRQRWAISPQQSNIPDELRKVSFTGAPVVVGQSVAVIGRIPKGQFEECYVLSFDLRSGNFRWSCYLASANTGMAMFANDMGIPASDVACHATYSAGRLYVMTNLGAVAALDAYSGATLWLSTYPRNIPSDMNMGFRRWGGMGGGVQPNPAKPWSYDPPIIHDGRVFAMPNDSDDLLVYDGATGQELKRIPRREFPNPPDTLLGVWGEWAIVTGDRMVQAIQWDKYKLVNNNNNIIVKSAGFDGIRGRGFLTADSVFVPTSKSLNRLKLAANLAETGLMTAETYPRDSREWDEATEGPGNVIVTNDHVVIAGAKHVDVYTDLQLARAKLEREIAAAGSDPEPRLKYAELLFAAGERNESLQKLDQAISLLGGLKTLRPGALRDRVFDRALTFAQKVGLDPTPDALDLANQLFDRAAAAASTPSQQVNYRITRAKFVETFRPFRAEDAAAEVKLYQEVLTDPAMRRVAVAQEDGAAPSLQADEVAEAAIRGLINKHGNACYDEFEHSAAAAFESAKGANDPAKLLEVAQTYPNSSVAPRALLAAADAYEGASNPRLATKVLLRVVRRFPDMAAEQQSAVFEALARNYLRMSDRSDIDTVAVAARWLGQKDSLLDNKLSKPLPLPGGQAIGDVTFRQAIDALHRLHNQVAARRLPDFHFPVFPRPEPGKKPVYPQPFLAETADTVIDGVDAIVSTLPSQTRNDRVVTWSGQNGVSVYAVGTNAPLVSSRALGEMPQGAAWVATAAKAGNAEGPPANLLVWDARSVALLGGDGRGGSVDPLWKVDLKALPAIEVVGGPADDGTAADAENVNVVDADLQNANLQEIVNAQRRQQMILRAQMMGRGGIQPAANLPPPALPVAGGGEQIMLVQPVGDHVLLATSTGRILCLNLSDGGNAWQTRLSNSPADRLLANEDFTVLRLVDNLSVQLVVLDTFSGAVLLRQSFSQQPAPNAAAPFPVVPLNLALSADGTLVYTLPDRIRARDLYEPSKEKFVDPQQQQPPPPNAAAPFAGCTQPDQLLITEGLILALSDNGQFVRVHSLETGLTRSQPLQTYTTNASPVSLRVVGPHLYVIGRESVASYDLDHPGEENWKGIPPTDAFASDSKANFVDAFIDPSYVVALNQQTGARRAGGAEQGAPGPGAPPAPAPAPAALPGPAGASSCFLCAYSRLPVSDKDPKESGRLDYLFEVSRPMGILKWVGVDGGFYYLTADQKLHYLRGARE